MKLAYDLEHQFWKTLKDNQLDQCESYLVATSGGLDSMVLLQLLSRTRPEVTIRVAHYHHGPCDSPYRDETLAWLKHETLKYAKAEFVFEQSTVSLKSEDEFRTARWAFLRRVRRTNEAIVTAHQQDDWVETSTLKLIRGTSGKGLSQFQVWNQEIFRPLLKHSKSELKQYAEVRKLNWKEDPTNSSTDFLRNWLRENWFKALEEKVPGGYLSFSRSLQQIATEFSDDSSFQIAYYQQNQAQGLDRGWYMTLSSTDQLKALAHYLRSNKIFSFTRGQLEEIQKRMEKNQKNISFEIVRKWVINATQIMLT
ncbi:MAG: tRNA lysidine(34) synthetase TilS [Bdellovibrionaceae bacterium]|nr:tRNA lysidine(34) synthetase TilS [Bdellovibrio sp.]